MAEEDRLGALMRDARTGNDAAYRQLLHEAATRLRGFLARQTWVRADAEDLVQECLIAMHERRDSYDARMPFAPWMLAIARYKLIDHFRRTERRMRGARELRHIHDDVAPAVDATVTSDIETLLAMLPEGQSEAIRLTRIDGLTSAEAAARMGIGVSAVKVRVHRGLVRLRQIVKDSAREGAA